MSAWMMTFFFSHKLELLTLFDLKQFVIFTIPYHSPLNSAIITPAFQLCRHQTPPYLICQLGNYSQTVYSPFIKNVCLYGLVRYIIHISPIKWASPDVWWFCSMVCVLHNDFPYMSEPFNSFPTQKRYVFLTFKVL